MTISMPLSVRQLLGCTVAHHTRRCLTLGSSNIGSHEMDEFMNNLGELLDRSEEEQRDKSKTPRVEDDGWRRIDWKSRFEAWRASALPTTEGSPVEPVLIRNRLVYMKRDDRIKLAQGAPISGNKARKMKSLHQLSAQEFPACVVSFGGPQSNAMLALAAIVHFQNLQAEAGDNSEPKAKNTRPLKRFVYYTKTLPRFLRNQPNGNLFRAQALGMELVELSPQEYAILFGGEWGGPTEPPPMDPPVPGDSLWVPQGGACGMALQGAWELAYEIVSFWSNKGKSRPLTVCIPGGTCSTAALVSSAIYYILNTNTGGSSNSQLPNFRDNQTEMDIRVVVIPCVGDEKYTLRQMMALLCANNHTGDKNTTGGDDTSLSARIPAVLPPTAESTRYFGQANQGKDDYFRFGEPHIEILSTFREMKEQYGVVLDLLYGAPSWTMLLRHFRTQPSARVVNDKDATFDPKAPLAGREIMYVHSGGLEGIVSQLNRYLYKGLVDLEEVQLPGGEINTNKGVRNGSQPHARSSK